MNTTRGTAERTRVFACIGAISLLSGCASLISNVATGMAENLTQAMLNQNDPEIVRDGAPSYMLLLDSMLESNPDDPMMLIAAAKLYALYGAVFADEPERAATLTERALDYAQRGVCNAFAQGCNWNTATFDEFEATLRGLSDKHAEITFGYSLAALAYTLAHADDMNVIARLPQQEALLVRYVEISGSAVEADAYTYLGILLTILPPLAGGRPEQAREYFERAIGLLGPCSLTAKVDLAENYARLLYDRALHDRLLNDVTAADANVRGCTLTNVLAQRRAADLLESAENYF